MRHACQDGNWALLGWTVFTYWDWLLYNLFSSICLDANWYLPEFTPDISLHVLPCLCIAGCSLRQHWTTHREWPTSCFPSASHALLPAGWCGAHTWQNVGISEKSQYSYGHRRVIDQEEVSLWISLKEECKLKGARSLFLTSPVGQALGSGVVSPRSDTRSFWSQKHIRFWGQDWGLRAGTSPGKWSEHSSHARTSMKRSGQPFHHHQRSGKASHPQKQRTGRLIF